MIVGRLLVERDRFRADRAEIASWWTGLPAERRRRILTDALRNNSHSRLTRLDADERRLLQTAESESLIAILVRP